MHWLLLRSVLVGGTVYVFGMSFVYLLNQVAGDVVSDAVGMSSHHERDALLQAAFAFILACCPLVAMLVQEELRRGSSPLHAATSAGASLIGGSATRVLFEGSWWTLMAVMLVPATLVLVVWVVFGHRVSDPIRRTRMLVSCSIVVGIAGSVAILGPVHDLLQEQQRARERASEQREWTPERADE